MSDKNRNTDVAVILGIVLVALGVVALISPLLGPVRYILWMLARIGWPIVLIIIGLLLILRARGRGWNTAGRTFRRSRTDRMLSGVLGGAATYLGVSSGLLRVAYVLLTLFTGVWLGVVLYLVAMIVVPEEPLPAGWQPPPAPKAPTPPPVAPPAPPAPASAVSSEATEPSKAPAAPAAPPAPAPPASPAPAAPAPPAPPAPDAP